MPAVWESMGNNSRSISGYCKVSQIDQSEPDGGKNRQEGKDLLEGGFRIIRSRRGVADQVNRMAGRKNIVGFLGKLSIAANSLIWFFAVLPGGKEGGSGVWLTGTYPEAVHKVIIRA